MADTAATFSINLEGNTSEKSKEDAAALEALRTAIKGSQDQLKTYSEALRGLKGNSEEVTQAKSQLKAKIDALTQSVGKSKLEVLKLGTTYESLRRKAKEAEDGQKAMGKAVASAGGPVQAIREKIGSLSELLGQGNSGAVLMAGGIALVAAAAAALTVVLVTGLVSLAKWAFEAADAARSLGLVREAATGSALNAANLGTQIDQLAKKIPTPKAELNELASTMARTLNNTTVSGQGIVDTFNLVAQASAAMGATVGNQLGGIIDRSKRFGRIQINPFELQGTGIKFEGVAAALAKNLNVPIETAKKALFEGRVKINDGAKAIRDAVDARFGEINARKMLSLTVIAEKVRETFAKLTTGIKIEALGAALQHFFKLFDSEETGTGKGLKALVDVLGNGLIKGLVALAPAAELVFARFIGLLLDVTIMALKAGIAIKKSFVGDALRSLFTAEHAVTALKVAFYGSLAVLGLFAAGVAVMLAPLALVGAAVYGVVNAFDGLKSVGATLADLADDAVDYGKDLVAGFVDGIKGGYSALKGAIGDMADSVKSSFKNALGISSPSKVFAKFGEQTAEGYALGIDGGTDKAQSAANALAPGAPPAQGGGARGGAVTINLTINATGKNGEDVANAIQRSSFLEDLTHALEEFSRGQGIPTT